MKMGKSLIRYVIILALTAALILLLTPKSISHGILNAQQYNITPYNTIIHVYY